MATDEKPTVVPDLGQLDAKLDQIVHESFSAELPDVLYHYTTWAGAEGIVSSKEFWFTAHDCTNDEAELDSADEIVLETAKDLRTTVDGQAGTLLDRLLTNYPQAKVTKVTPVFLACFSEAKNSHSQWQMYAEQGRGLCLGLRVLRHEAMPENSGVRIALLRVDYSEASWRERVGTGLREVCEALSQFKAKNIAECPPASELALSAMYRIAAFAAITAKKPQWAREKEWRQVAVVRKGFSVQPYERKSSGRTVRYLKLRVRGSDKLLALDEIIIGPHQDAELAGSRLQHFLAETGYPSADAELPRIAVASAE